VPPTDLLYDVRFRGLADGSLHGTVVDRHRTGIRPQLFATLNHHTPEPLALYESSADGTVHHFSIALRADRLVDGANVIRIAAIDGQPLAAYPISLGAQQESSSERRIVALEAELAFLKKMVPQPEPRMRSPPGLTLLKGEIIGICSEMMTLQRVNFEREVFGVRNDANHVHRLPVQAAAAEGESEVAPPRRPPAPVRKARAFLTARAPDTS
jgi:hypothetical protein